MRILALQLVPVSTVPEMQSPKYASKEHLAGPLILSQIPNRHNTSSIGHAAPRFSYEKLLFGWRIAAAYGRPRSTLAL